MRINDRFTNTQENAVSNAGDDLPAALEPTQRLADVRKFALFPS